MKKIILGAALLLTGLFAKAQNGLENVIVEKYYVSNAADAAGSVGNLPVGSVTYRIWADMLPGYNFQALYGVANHTLNIQTSTTFFNNEDYGGTTPSISATNVRKNSALLDSWFSVGGAANGKVAVYKSEDTDGSPGNAQGILQNNDPSTTGAINIGSTASTSAQDGMIAGSPVAVTFVGINNTGNGDLGVFDGTSQVGGSFTTSNGSVAALGGATGATAANRVLIGQFTTDGIFSFQLNIQIGTPTGGTQNFVASNPVGAEIQASFLTGTFGAPNTPPTVSITAPANGAGFITGSIVNITANAADADGSVTQVQFFVDGVSVGIDAIAPYAANYTSVAGSHSLTAVATDNNGATTTSSVIVINVANNPPPTVNITNPANGASFITGATVTIDATATDNSSVTQVQFFVDGISVGIDNTSPYSATYTAVNGSHCITATATDNLGATSTTGCTNITVAANPAPTVSITAPAANTSFITGSTVNITATAADNGSVMQVEFFVDGVSVGIDASSPYAATYITSTLGQRCITATATDNNGATTTTACRFINVVSSILPYKIVTTQDLCLPTTFCLPVAAVATVDNVIGYDVVLQYNPAKVTPTGNITVFNNLVTPSQVDVINSIDAANGLMNISLFFNGTAPATAEFNGTGNIFCVEFTKTASFGFVDTAAFSLPTVQESYFTGVLSQLADGGNYNTYKDTTFTAGLRFWNGNSALAYDQLNPATYLLTNIYGTDAACANQSATAVQPDLAGNFAYLTPSGTNVSIQRDILAATDVQPVVNGFDALLARKVLVNDLTFIPEAQQMVAMDVNIDGVVSAGDISQINQRTVLIINEFRQAWNYNAQGQSNGQPSKDWLFVDTTITLNGPAYQISATYPANDGVGYSKAKSPIVPFCLPVPVTNPTLCPDIAAETYHGVLLGDVNGNFATVGSGGVLRSNSADRVTFDMSKAEVNGNTISIPVSVSSVNAVNALDFAMQFNGSKISFNQVKDVTGKMESLANFNAADKTLRFTSYSLNEYEQNNTVVSVEFTSANAAAVTENDLSNVAAYINGEPVIAEVISRNGVSSLTANENNVSIYPNPAINTMFVTSMENAVVQLMDATGRIVMQANITANEKMELNTANIASGVYTVNVKAASFNEMKKVVIKK